MISHKIKCKPPPLHLSNNVEECPQLVDALATSKESRVCNKGDDHAEFSFLYESALIDLLDESELMPFNLHTAASLGITECVRSLIERFDTYSHYPIHYSLSLHVFILTSQMQY